MFIRPGKISFLNHLDNIAKVILAKQLLAGTVTVEKEEGSQIDDGYMK